MQARAFQHLRVLERSIDPSAELWFPTGQVGEAAFVSIPVARGAEDEEPGRAHSTRTRLRWLLNRWVIPRWGKVNINAVNPVAVEEWLKTLSKIDSEDRERLARGSRAKIRNAMSCASPKCHPPTVARFLAQGWTFSLPVSRSYYRSCARALDPATASLAAHIDPKHTHIYIRIRPSVFGLGRPIVTVMQPA